MQAARDRSMSHPRSDERNRAPPVLTQNKNGSCQLLAIMDILLACKWEAPMAGCQYTEANRRQKSFHRGDSSLLCSSVCEGLEEEEEEEEEEAVSSPATDYAQQLCSILGYETAEYFLNPPPMDFQVSPSLQEILDEMEDPLGAEELWRILQAKSKQKLREEYGEPIRPEMINILKNFAQRPTMQKVATKRHHLTYIRQTLQHQQDLTNMLLSENPLPDINDRGTARIPLSKYGAPMSYRCGALPYQEEM